MWQGFAKAHEPVIEGLRHGGVAQTMRRRLSSFGSGWRGIIGMNQPEMKALLHGEHFGESLSPDQISGLASNNPYLRLTRAGIDPDRASKVTKDLIQASQWSQKTGFGPVVIHRGMPSTTLRTTIRHERIHSFHDFHGTRPFVVNEIKASPPLEQSMRAAAEHILGRNPRAIRDSKLPAHIKSLDAFPPTRPLAHKLAKDAFVKGSMAAYEHQSPAILESERLAWGRELDKTFFPRAAQAGYRMPQTALARSIAPPSPRAVESLMLAGRGPGHALAGGWAAKIARGARKMLRSI